ncbi:hypothetical protein ACPV5L_14220 [Vibrio astriarenae]|jgi:hypothetical protein|uniref:Integral membrane protein n=1 Tax=Vibrio agarivorans TaxID=153622 RepID=A0ABT7Y0V8_9VIBR|nr:hypothetical protein [Vibrio agarivorans]MDN2481678.1 hypothetical protein [Vibrio agarivorans]
MVYSTIQFLATVILAVICSQAMMFSQGELPALVVLIPALWLVSQLRSTGVLFVITMLVYGLTLSHQPVALSVGLWMLAPLLMVVFSHRSTLWVIGTTGLITLTLLVGITLTQSAGRLDGSAMVTVVQTLCVISISWCLHHWKPCKSHSWWTLGLLVPMWISGLVYAALVTLCITAIMGTVEHLAKLKNFRWSKLLTWTLPTVGFAALVVHPDVDVPHPVFVLWFCLLGTAWMTDYILRVAAMESEGE